MWVYVLSVAAAALFAGGSVVQQQVAGQSPPEKAFSAGLLAGSAAPEPGGNGTAGRAALTCPGRLH